MGFVSPLQHADSFSTCTALAVQGALYSVERNVSEEQFIPSIFGEQELGFRGAYISPRSVTSRCTPDIPVAEISRDEFKPTLVKCRFASKYSDEGDSFMSGLS